METNYIRKYPLSLFTACFIIFLSLYPFKELPQVDVPLADKWTHMVMYGGFCLVIWFEYLRKHKNIHVGKITLFGWFCPSVMSGLLELAQAYLTTSRSGEWMDFLANAIGATLAYILGWALLRKIIPPKSSAQIL
jgi:VanZ family protein